MKLILILSSLLISSILSVEVSIEEADGQMVEAAHVQNRASRVLFSWCDHYKSNCESGCSKTVCGSRSKCKIIGGFFHCEYLCEDVTSECVSGDSTTTEATTEATTSLTCKLENDPCAPNTSGPTACCSGLTCEPNPADQTQNICQV